MLEAVTKAINGRFSEPDYVNYEKKEGLCLNTSDVSLEI